ncbi:MAG: AbrB family transcriptional regulator [Deltaproteobacteria bacterium]|nr:MAG: AbrB family transcriptional regulator [Deltaproteobacteria bacterium]
MKAETQITSKGQVVIPKQVREYLRWRPGTRLCVEVAGDGGVVLRRQQDDFEDLLEQLSGCLEEGNPLAELESEHRAEVAEDGRQRRG